MEWLFSRSIFYVKHNGWPDFDNICGAKDDKDGTFIIWYFDFPNEKLYVMFITGTSKSLIKAAILQARKYSFSVFIYNPHESFLAMGKLEEERSGDISQLAMYGKAREMGDLEWVLNEKYAWV
jgi:hypothetical protein